MTTTVKEQAVLVAIYWNFYGNCGISERTGREQRLDSPVWSDCINHSSKPSGVEGRSLPGVVSSLAKKGLVTCDKDSEGDLITLTEAGLAALPADAKGAK